jgi:predicted GNAT family acetyltransferase
VTREDGGIVFTHTEVDPELQERGLGSMLIRGALDAVRVSTSVRIGATCPFVRRFLKEHPEYQDLTTR